jgi:hypothetical protein
MPIPPKPTFVLGSYSGFIAYQREHPEMWLVHVQGPHDADGFEGSGIIIVDNRYPEGLYTYALSRVR